MKEYHITVRYGAGWEVEVADWEREVYKINSARFDEVYYHSAAQRKSGAEPYHFKHVMTFNQYLRHEDAPPLSEVFIDGKVICEEKEFDMLERPPGLVTHYVKARFKRRPAEKKSFRGFCRFMAEHYESVRRNQ